MTMPLTATARPERQPIAHAPAATRVTEVDVASGHYTLFDGRRTRSARRALSCLVLPAVGDSVACSPDPGAAPDAGPDVGGDSDVAWITAVLLRASDAPLTVSLPPGSTIACTHGTLVLQADALHLRARALGVEGEQAHLNVEQVSGVGRRASWSYGAVKLTAELVESFAERMVQFSRWSQRMVDGPDMVRSRQIDWRAEQTMQLQAQVLIANADKLFKADAEQIHLG